jgi:Domain of unknown function (DUF5666)
MKKQKFFLLYTLSVLAITLCCAYANSANASTSQNPNPWNNQGAMSGDMGRGTPPNGQQGPQNGQQGQGLMGTISAIDGSTLTVKDNGGTSYAVDASNAAVKEMGKPSSDTTTNSDRNSKPAQPTEITLALSDLAVGDTVMIKGDTSGTTVTATEIVRGNFQAPTDDNKGAVGGTKNNKGGNKNFGKSNTETTSAADCQKTEKSANTANIKSAKDTYNSSLKDSKDQYTTQTKTAKDSYNEAFAAEKTRHQDAVKACAKAPDCLKAEKSTNAANVKDTKNTYNSALKDAKARYSSDTKSAKDTYTAANSSETTRHKNALGSCGK